MFSSTCQESKALPQVTLGLMRPLAILLVTLLLALDWAAFHDIVIGEPDVKGEVATVALSLLIFVVLWYAKCK